MNKPAKITDPNAILDPCRTVVIGVGGGGVNTLSNMLGEWSEGPDLVAVHTDGQKLKSCGVSRKIQLGAGITGGMGCGGDLVVGKRAAQADYPVIRDLFSGVDLAFIVTSLGGGTGTGAAPVIAQVAREEGVLSLCIASMPFNFEGDEKQLCAEKGLDSLMDCADAVVCMPNERLIERMGSWKGLAQALKKVDAELAAGVKTMWTLFRQTGIIHLDMSDLRKLTENAGHFCVLAMGHATGKDKAKTAVSSLLKHPSLDGGNVLGRTTGIIAGILGGIDLTLQDINSVMKEISESTSGNVRISVGAGIEKGRRDFVSLILLASDSLKEPELDKQEESGMAASSSDDSSGPKAPRQENLNLEPAGRGVFRGVEPTFHEGEDLDIPTFIRRGIRIER